MCAQRLRQVSVAVAHISCMQTMLAGCVDDEVLKALWQMQIPAAPKGNTTPLATCGSATPGHLMMPPALARCTGTDSAVESDDSAQLGSGTAPPPQTDTAADHSGSPKKLVLKEYQPMPSATPDFRQVCRHKQSCFFHAASLQHDCLGLAGNIQQDSDPRGHAATPGLHSLMRPSQLPRYSLQGVLARLDM